MASIEGFGEGFRGKIDGMSFYKRRDLDKTIARRSAGHTKERIKSDPNLDRFRRAQSEFGGRTVAGKFLMRALVFQKPLADYNIAGPLTALLKPVQERDITSDYGERNVIISQNAHFLKGFLLNRKNPFDTVIKYPVVGTIDRSTLSARVQLPELMPDINFSPGVEHPYYSFRLVLAVVPDIVLKEKRYGPIHPDYPEACAVYQDSEWFPLLQGSAAMEMAIQHNFIPPDENFTLVLSVGIRYGILKSANEIVQAPYAGSAKILEVG